MTDSDDDLLARVRTAVGDRYRVQRVIGRGGMATVFLADDVRHERPVAIKVLAPELGAIIGAERFLKEIKVTANLQHPHILGLIDSGEADGLLWYAMPFVDGESLRQRLERERQLPVADAVRIAREVGDALHYAHRQGIIHRDVKPENVLLRDGHALVADFGIALAASRAGGSRLTGTGLSLGTPSYMSPEQAQGDRELDARTDQYSLGAMLYEMLSGQPPHVGPTVQALMAGLLTKEPAPLTELRSTVPPHVAATVHTALAKLPADRFATTGDFAAALTDPAITGATSFRLSATMPAAPRRRTGVTVAIVAAALVLGAAGGRLMRSGTAASEAVAPVAFEVVPDSGLEMSSWPQLSFDGTTLFFVGHRAGATAIYARSLGAIENRPVPGTDGVLHETFAVAADGKSLLVSTRDGFRRVGVDGTSVLVPSPPQASEADVTIGVGLPDGSFVFSLSWNKGAHWAFYLFPVSGDAPRRILVEGDSSALLSGLSALDDPRTVLVARGFGANAVIGLVDLASGKFRPIRQGLAPQMVGKDQLLYGDRGGTLWVQRVDFATGDTLGPSRRLADNAYVWLDALVAVTAGRTGVVAWVPRSVGATTLQLRAAPGGARPLLMGPKFWEPRFSPDGHRIAFARYLSEANLGELWLYDLRTQTDQRVTATGIKGADVNDVVWMPDGKHMVVSAYDSANGFSQAPGKGLWVLSLDDGAPPRRLLKRPGDQWPATLTPDGRTLLYVQRNSPDDHREIWSVSMDGGDPHPVLQTPFNVGAPRVSPDGQWLAFDSDETGTREVYVQRYPGPGDRLRLSTSGGRTPVFTRGGREVVYWEGANLVAVSLQLGSAHPIGDRRTIGPVSFPAFTELPQYDVTADGNTVVAVQTPPAANRIIIQTGVGRYEGRAKP